MADVVLDANVLVGLFDRNDALHVNATRLVGRITSTGDTAVLLDFCLAEALSVLCRRARERKANPPDLGAIFGEVRRLNDAGKVERVPEHGTTFGAVLDVMDAMAGALNFNDALLVVLQREGAIGDVASFDRALDTAEGFRRLG